MENGRPVTHLTYSATGTGSRPAGFFPDADFEAELLPFRRSLPGLRPGDGRRDRHWRLRRRRAAARGGRAVAGPGTAPDRARGPQAACGVPRRPVGAGHPPPARSAGASAGHGAGWSASSTGFLVAALTGWVIALVLVPVLALGLPYLLSAPKPRDVELLEAMDRWVRSLGGDAGDGQSITDAIRISRRTAPPLLAEELAVLVLRLNNRWETRDALLRFADALDVTRRRRGGGRVDAGHQPGDQRRLGDPAGAGGLDPGAAQSPSGDRGRAIEAVRGRPAGDGDLSAHPGRASSCCRRPSSRPTARRSARLLLSGLLVLYFGSLLLMRRKAAQRPRPRVLVARPR